MKKPPIILGVTVLVVVLFFSFNILPLSRVSASILGEIRTLLMGGSSNKGTPLPSPASTSSPARGKSITWGATTNLTKDAKNRLSPANGFQLATDSSGRLHVGFRKMNETEEVYYMRYANGSWEAAKKLSNIASLGSLSTGQRLDVNGPAVAVSPSGDVHVVWNFAVLDSSDKVVKDRRIYYQRSVDGGATFSTQKLLGTGGDDFGGATVCSGESGTRKIVNIISTDVPRKALYSYYSSDNGATFTKHPIATYSSAKEAPVCAIDSQGITYVVWQDDRDGVVSGGFRRRDVHFSRSLDGGKTWETAKNLTKTPSYGSSDQSLALGPDGKVHVVYHDDANDGNDSWEMYYVGSPDKGVTWGPVQKLTTTDVVMNRIRQSVNIDLPTVAATADGGIYMVWQDNRNGYFRTFFKSSNGVTWSPETAISSKSHSAASPSIAVSRDGSAIHVIWQDAVTVGSPDIFYRRARLQ